MHEAQPKLSFKNAGLSENEEAINKWAFVDLYREQSILACILI